MPTLPSEVEYCALLSYATHPVTEEEKRSKSLSVGLKQGRRFSQPPLTFNQLVAERVRELRDSPEFRNFFGPDVLAIPIPSSSLKQPGSLWVPLDLSVALKDAGLVGDALPLVERIRALPKSAFSLPANRSKAGDHFDSVQVIKKLIAPSSILLVDDVITRGATILGIAGRVAEAYPGVPIRGFAAMRAISDVGAFSKVLDPCKGRIELVGDQTYRRP